MENPTFRHVYEAEDGNVMVEEQDIYGYGEGRQANRVEALVFKARRLVGEVLASIGEAER